MIPILLLELILGGTEEELRLVQIRAVPQVYGPKTFLK